MLLARRRSVWRCRPRPRYSSVNSVDGRGRSSVDVGGKCRRDRPLERSTDARRHLLRPARMVAIMADRSSAQYGSRSLLGPGFIVACSLAASSSCGRQLGECAVWANGTDEVKCSRSMAPRMSHRFMLSTIESTLLVQMECLDEQSIICCPQTRSHLGWLGVSVDQHWISDAADMTLS
nr:hypothetical protein CFP56_01069 [Quercus suber]